MKGRFGMRKLISVLNTLAFASFLAMPTSAQSVNVNGDWDLTINSPQGTFNPKASLKQEGEKLTGALKGQRGELPVTGTVKDKEITITWTTKFQDQDMVITLTGTIDGDSIKGGADYGGLAQGDWTAKRATAAAADAAKAAGAATATAAASSPVTAAQGDKIDVTGAWNFEVETQAGTGNPTFTFKQDGEKLTGRYKGALGEADLTGTVKGSAVEFSFKVSGQVEGTVTYTGTTDGKTMKGKVKLAELGEGTFTGKKQ
jgi:hypothetical protein